MSDQIDPTTREIDPDDILDKIPDDYIREAIRDGKTRRDRAAAAMNIPRDRYGAGSAGARAAIAVMLLYGAEAAVEFADDIEHHED